MSAGRCAGCRKTGQPAPLRTHVTECAAWLALPPDRQLDPEAEYRRWIEQDRDTERDVTGSRRLQQPQPLMRRLARGSPAAVTLMRFLMRRPGD